jgi:hypothetical protein
MTFKEVCNLPEYYVLYAYLSVWVGWGHKANHALRPFSNLSCVPICFIPPVVRHIWQSTVSYITEFQSSRLVPKNCLPKRRILNSDKAFPIFSCRFLVVHISPTRTGELDSHYQQSPMRVKGVHTTGCCPVPRRDLLRHCCHHLSAVQPSARCLTPWYDYLKWFNRYRQQTKRKSAATTLLADT